MSHAVPTDPPDPVLLRRAAAGDRGAFDLLVERHRAAVFRWARSLTGADDVAEDVMQETFLAAYRHAGGHQGRSSVKTWLLTIARNQVRRRHRKPEPRAESETSLEHLGAAAGWGSPIGPDPERTVLEAERARWLRAALERLADSDREVLVARDLEGLSGPESATLLDISLPAMKARLHRARLRLVAELRQGGRIDGT